jgi:hypothetical protein
MPAGRRVFYVVAAVDLGLVGDALLRGTPWGINLPLWVLILAVTAALAPGERGPVRREAQALVWASLVCAAALVWRAAPPLMLANLMATAGLLVLALVRAHGLRLESHPIGRLVGTATRASLRVVEGAVPALAGWRPAPSPAFGRRVRAVATGVALALPISAVFTVLLAAADPVFERAVRLAFSWDAERLVSHAVLSTAIAWVACGYLLGLRPRARAPEVAEPGDGRRLALGLVELGIPLGGLAALFAVFVGFQTRYFFGGDAVVLSTAELGWGDYARRGFFELVAVTGLVVPLLLGADGVVNRGDPRAVRGLRGLSAVLLALVALIAGSAVYRLWLYYGVYGLTPTRVYAAAFMAWIGLVLAWFGVTVLRGHRGAFPIGAIVSGLGVLACLNLLNPDGLVARVNLERAREGHELDVELLAHLSPDALPAVAGALERSPSEATCGVVQAIAVPDDRSVGRDWRSWNLSRARARGFIPTLLETCAPQRAPPS